TTRGRSMALVTFACPDCGERYQAPRHRAGRWFSCTACGWPVRVPGRATAPIAPLPDPESSAHPAERPTGAPLSVGRNLGARGRDRRIRADECDHVLDLREAGACRG